MITGGSDGMVRIWDMRTYKETHRYNTPKGTGLPTCLDLSQGGILGIGFGCHSTFWSPDATNIKVKDPYMGHVMAGCSLIETLKFYLYEDVCGIGHSKGF